MKRLARGYQLARVVRDSGVRLTTFDVTNAGRAAIGKPTRCILCNEPAVGELYTNADVGMKWWPMCERHLAPRGDGVVRWWAL